MNSAEAELKKIKSACQAIQKAGVGPIDVALVLGSGLGDYAKNLKNPISLSYTGIPHFEKPQVEGHAGQLIYGTLNHEKEPLRVLALQGRFHFYEGHTLETVIRPIRVLKLLEAKSILVTNAAGGINSTFSAGDLMLIEDHLNLTGDNPLVGPNLDSLGPRFPDLSRAYDPSLRNQVEAAAKESGVSLQKGIYAGLKGPSYETPAEVRMLRTLGADATGMSTVYEVIAANHMGIPICGISCITNLAAGMTGEPLSHLEVIETTKRSYQTFAKLLDTLFYNWTVKTP